MVMTNFMFHFCIANSIIILFKKTDFFGALSSANCLIVVINVSCKGSDILLHAHSDQCQCFSCTNVL